MKKKQIIKWAVCFALNKKCLSGHVNLFDKKSEAKQYNKELHQKIGGFEEDHHIIKVLITSAK